MSDALDITLPHNKWLPRPHQEKLWNYLVDGGKRALAIWHRRAGKDEIALHFCAVSMMRRPANYAYCLPLFAHGRRVIWDAINPHTGKRRIDEAFPPVMRSRTQDHEMQLTMCNGSTFSVIGSDNYNTSLVGTSYAGVIFSEYALANPSAWAYARPMIQENDGWALFITTPRGRNHAHDMYRHAMTAPDWFCELQTVHDTRALTEAQLRETLAEMCALYGLDAGTAIYKQEMECDFSAALLGAMYSHEMREVRMEGRVMVVEPPPNTPVHRSFDIGVHDDTSIWWFCVAGSQVYILDHYSSSNVGIEHYRDVIFKRGIERGWTHGVDYVPHDAKVQEWGTGRTRVEAMRLLGLRPMLVPRATMQDGISAVRLTLPLCVFHPRCEVGGIDALEQYRREWDDESKCFKPNPLHDWTSNPADSFRYLSMAWRSAPLIVASEPKLEGWRIPPPVEPHKGIQL
jgi:phage terminase large subunit